MAAPRQAPSKLTNDYLKATLEDLILLEEQHPDSITIEWLYQYCETNSLCLLPPANVSVISLLRGLDAYVKAFKFLEQLPQGAETQQAAAQFAETMFKIWLKKALDNNCVHAQMLDVFVKILYTNKLTTTQEMLKKIQLHENEIAKLFSQRPDVANLYLGLLYSFLAQELLRTCSGSSSNAFFHQAPITQETFAMWTKLKAKTNLNLNQFENLLPHLSERTQNMLKFCKFVRCNNSLETKIKDEREELARCEKIFLELYREPSLRSTVHFKK